MPAAILMQAMRWSQEPEDKLLVTARDYASKEKPADFQTSVVFSQIACEVSAEAAFAAVIKKRNLADIEEALDGLLPGYNLGNERIRKLYTALSGDKIHETKFWPAFQEHLKRRNEIVHKAKNVTRTEAQASIDAATALVSHLRARRRA